MTEQEEKAKEYSIFVKKEQTELENDIAKYVQNRINVFRKSTGLCLSGIYVDMINVSNIGENKEYFVSLVSSSLELE